MPSFSRLASATTLAAVLSFAYATTNSVTFADQLPAGNTLNACDSMDIVVNSTDTSVKTYAGVAYSNDIGGDYTIYEVDSFTGGPTTIVGFNFYNEKLRATDDIYIIAFATYGEEATTGSKISDGKLTIGSDTESVSSTDTSKAVFSISKWPPTDSDIGNGIFKATTDCLTYMSSMDSGVPVSSNSA